MYMSKIYAIYDMKDNEQCIGVFDKLREIAEYFNMSERCISSEISRKRNIKNQYKVVRIE